jgi:hypothetical protein
VRVGNLSSSGYTDYLTILETRPITEVRNAVLPQKDIQFITDFKTSPLTSHLLSAAVEGGGTYTTDIEAWGQSSGNVFTATAHGLAANEEVVISTGFAGVAAGTYIVKADPGVNTFQLTTDGSTIVNLTSDATGTVTKTTTVSGSSGELGYFPTNATVNTKIRGYKAYRVNLALNATMPATPYKLITSTSTDGLKLEHRHEYRLDNVSTNHTIGNLFYPLYKVNKWLTNTGEITVALDHGVKSLKWLKLIGYSCFNKRQVGFQVGHEMIADDWIALHINEVEGNVVSNNKTANGAFCVLHVGSSKDNEAGAVEYHQHDPNGLYTHYFENHQSTIRNLHLKLLDRQGNPAHFGRIHLWFKACVQHG